MCHNAQGAEPTQARADTVPRQEEPLPVGWRSQLAMALTVKKKRLVLHGNVLDDVVTSSGSAPFVPWLVSRLAERGYRRIVHYECQGPPQILAWEDGRPGGSL